MAALCTFWGWQPLSKGPLSFAVLSQKAGQGGGDDQPVIAVASDGISTVAILPVQLGEFARLHQEVVVICHEAARLHWLLHHHLSASENANAVAALWALSRDSRLIDIMLLDQEIRRFHGEALPPRRSLTALAEHYIGTPVPSD
jgi:hypothetical protein